MFCMVLLYECIFAFYAITWEILYLKAGAGGGIFTIEKKTMLNMVKLCVIPEKKPYSPPQNFHSRRVFFNSHYLEFPLLFSGLNSQYM